MSILDKLSPQLRKQYSPPRDKEARTYRLLGITKKRGTDGSTRYTIPMSKSLPDSYIVRDGDEMKTIVYTSKMVPTEDPSFMRRLSESIEFLQQNMGEIRIHKDNYHLMKEIDIYLFFSPWLMHSPDENGSVRRDWQVPTKLGFVYELIDSRSKAERELEIEDLITDAKLAVREMSEKDQAMFLRMFKLGDDKKITQAEIRANLLKFVSKEKGARALIKATNQDEVEIRRLINEAVDKGFIAKNETDWYYVEGEEVIAQKLPKKTMEDSLIAYLKTDGGERVRELLLGFVKSSPKNSKKAKVKV